MSRTTDKQEAGAMQEGRGQQTESGPRKKTKKVENDIKSDALISNEDKI